MRFFWHLQDDIKDLWEVLTLLFKCALVWILLDVVLGTMR